MSTNKVAPVGEQGEGKIQTQPSKLHRVIRSISNVFFSLVASTTTFGFGFMMGLLWVAIMAITCFHFPPTKMLWTYKEVHGTWIKSFGDLVYTRKTDWWVEKYATCPDSSDWAHSNLSSVYPSNTKEFAFAHSSLKAHVRASSCSSNFRIPDDDLEAPTRNGTVGFNNFKAFYLTQPGTNETDDIQSLWESSPVHCECKGWLIDLDLEEEYLKTFFVGVDSSKLRVANGYHGQIIFQDGLSGLNNRVMHSGGETDKLTGCCSCSSTTDYSIEVPDYCTTFEDEDTYFRESLPITYFIGWDCLSFFMVLGTVHIIMKATGKYEFITSKDKKGVMITYLLSSLFYTVFGDTLMRMFMGISFKIKAFCQMGVVIVTAIYGGKLMSKYAFREGAPYNDYPLSFSKNWYIWSLFGPALMAAFAGPLAVTVFIEPMFNDPGTSDTVRLIIATFGIPIVFWIIMTCGRFAAGRMAQYGRKKNHPIAVQHLCYLAFTGIQIIYSVYSRAFVAGTAGASEDVGYSISARSPLIIAAFTSNIAQIIARRTTQWRDTGMYKLYYCGKKQVGTEYFDDPNVSRFLERDMLLFESLFDVMSLSYVTYILYIFEIQTGVDPDLAAGAGFLNWLVQMIIEQLGNFVIFYLRQRRRVVFTKAGKNGEQKNNDSGSLSKSTEKRSSSLMQIKQAKEISKRIFMVLTGAVWSILFMPYFGVLVSTVIGGSFMRSTILYWNDGEIPVEGEWP